VLGYVLPAMGFTWHYHDLISIYNKLVKQGYTIIYLTARSFSEYGYTRRYLDTVKHDTLLLPRGPLLMYPKSFMSVMRSEIVAKTADVRIC
jgi:phosphatidate phosphatase PAH1